MSAIKRVGVLFILLAVLISGCGKRIAQDSDIEIHSTWEPQIIYLAFGRGPAHTSWLVEGTITNTSKYVAPIVEITFYAFNYDKIRLGVEFEIFRKLQPHETREFRVIVGNTAHYNEDRSVAKAGSIRWNVRVYANEEEYKKQDDERIKIIKGIIVNWEPLRD